jgi:FkbM family methyltransferase
MRADESGFAMWWRWHLYRRWKNDPGRKSMYDFRRYLLAAPAGALAIDCGANVGDITAAMVKAGLRVIAFEPDADCVAELHRRFDSEPRVTIVPRAVGASDRRAPFYHKISKGRPVSDASSFILMKHHQPEPVGEIEVIDLLTFLSGLTEPVYLLKMDIEGAEAEVLEALLDRSTHRSVGRIFVETHEWLDEGLAARLQAIRRRMTGPDFTNIDLEWG